MSRHLFALLVLLAQSAIAAETTLPDRDGLPNWLYTPSEQPDAAKTYRLVVGVHGAGGTGKGAGGVAGWASDFDDVLVLGPSFEQPKRDPNAPRPTTMPRDIFQMSGPAHEAKLDTLIAEISKTWKLRPKIFLHGFSAGAQFAHRYAFHHPERVVGVSAHSGGSWAKLDGDDRINPEAKAIPFVLSCGEDDKGSGGPPGTATRIEGVKRFAADLQSLGFTIEMKTWPGIGHDQTAEAKAMGKALLEKVRGENGSRAARPKTAARSLPASWDGVWRGDIEVRDGGEVRHRTTMELRVQATDGEEMSAALQPHLLVPGTADALTEYFARMDSLACVQAFSWQEGCVLDGLLDLAALPAHWVRSASHSISPVQR